MERKYKYRDALLTEQEFHALSWLGYYNRMFLSEPADNREYARGATNAAYVICDMVLNIPMEILWRIKEENDCTGLRNWNQLQNNLFWEK